MSNRIYAMLRQKKRGPVSYSTYQEAKDRIAELEALFRAEQGYTELNEARIAELEKLWNHEGDMRSAAEREITAMTARIAELESALLRAPLGWDARIRELEKVAEAVMLAKSIRNDHKAGHAALDALDDALREAGYGGGE